ncbi:MAG: hypothetical protein FJ403_18410 [Verrucomicrobia bacterium]|nr:hypothetical protein [Verrucomicrobiota bacterium]
MQNQLIQAGIAVFLLFGHFSAKLQAQPKFTPTDIGQTVNGYQDDFTGTTRNSNWIPVPPELDMYEQANGVLKVTVVGEALDTHLLYQAQGYGNTVQEVLARIRVTAFGTGDGPRCGVAVAVDPVTSQGINLHFRDHNQDGVLGRQFKLLDDRRAWGPRGLDIDWEDNVWYWLRLRQTGPGTAPTNNINGKVWLADGSVPEPSGWQMNWRRSGRTGFAGLVGASIGGLSEYEVDYILIKAEGLPSIKVTAEAFPTPLFLIITQQPQNATVDAGRTATFAVEASSSATPAYQWQKANAGSTNFADIPGATSKTYTTAPLVASDNGTKFRSIVTLGGATVTSQAGTLTIESPPALVSASAGVDRALNSITLVFSEPVSASTATNTANYAIPGVTISAASLAAGGTKVVLRTGVLNASASYQLSVSGVQDLAGNTISANSQMGVSLALHLPSDFGQTVSGFQDDFAAATRDPNWAPVPPEKDNYEQANGLLRVTVLGDNPGLDTHLLYEAPDYSFETQEVLARIRITAFGAGDAPRCGVAVGVDGQTSQGINLHFRDNDQDGISGRQFKLLDDRRAWGPPGLDIDWENNTWYWLRLRQTTSAPVDTPNIQAKVWPADGTVIEPTDWQLSWMRSDRIGFAGLVGSSIGGLSEYEVDYVLIKAGGLPSIKVGSSTYPAAAPPLPAIRALRAGNVVTLTWTGSATLEAADRVNGPWTAVGGASSPHSVALAGAGKFYRLRQ